MLTCRAHLALVGVSIPPRHMPPSMQLQRTWNPVLNQIICFFHSFAVLTLFSISASAFLNIVPCKFFAANFRPYFFQHNMASTEAATNSTIIPRYVYRLAFASEWDAVEADGEYKGAEIDAKDGFIHLSTQAQCQLTAQMFFKGAENLQSWTIDTSLLNGVSTVHPAPPLGSAAKGASKDTPLELRWEPAPDRPEDDLFPHVYGTLPKSAIIKQSPLPLGEDGVPTFPEGTFETE